MGYMNGLWTDTTFPAGSFNNCVGTIIGPANCATNPKLATLASLFGLSDISINSGMQLTINNNSNTLVMGVHGSFYPSPAYITFVWPDDTDIVAFSWRNATRKDLDVDHQYRFTYSTSLSVNFSEFNTMIPGSLGYRKDNQPLPIKDFNIYDFDISAEEMDGKSVLYVDTSTDKGMRFPGYNINSSTNQNWISGYNDKTDIFTAPAKEYNVDDLIASAKPHISQNYANFGMRDDITFKKYLTADGTTTHYTLLECRDDPNGGFNIIMTNYKINRFDDNHKPAWSQVGSETIMNISRMPFYLLTVDGANGLPYPENDTAVWNREGTIDANKGYLFTCGETKGYWIQMAHGDAISIQPFTCKQEGADIPQTNVSTLDMITPYYYKSAMRIRKRGKSSEKWDEFSIEMNTSWCVEDTAVNTYENSEQFLYGYNQTFLNEDGKQYNPAVVEGFKSNAIKFAIPKYYNLIGLELELTGARMKRYFPVRDYPTVQTEYSDFILFNNGTLNMPGLGGFKKLNSRAQVGNVNTPTSVPHKALENDVLHYTLSFGHDAASYIFDDMWETTEGQTYLPLLQEKFNYVYGSYAACDQKIGSPSEQSVSMSPVGYNSTYGVGSYFKNADSTYKSYRLRLQCNAQPLHTLSDDSQVIFPDWDQMAPGGFTIFGIEKK